MNNRLIAITFFLFHQVTANPKFSLCKDTNNAAAESGNTERTLYLQNDLYNAGENAYLLIDNGVISFSNKIKLPKSSQLQVEVNGKWYRLQKSHFSLKNKLRLSEIPKISKAN